jgi:hypothetical protein
VIVTQLGVKLLRNMCLRELFRGKAQPHDVGEGTTCWPAPESTDNMNTSRVGRLGLSDAEEDAIVSFMQTLTDGFMPVNQQ